MEGDRLAKVIVSLLPDSVPELEEVYIIQLSSIAGGAELDIKRSKTQIKVRANDEPHGTFALYPEFQSLEVNPTNYTRYISLNITRHAGPFGNVTVDYRVTGSMPNQGALMDAILGSLFVKDRAKFARTTVPLSSQVSDYETL